MVDGGWSARVALSVDTASILTIKDKDNNEAFNFDAGSLTTYLGTQKVCQEREINFRQMALGIIDWVTVLHLLEVVR